jgi:hypothetical protein
VQRIGFDADGYLMDRNRVRFNLLKISAGVLALSTRVFWGSLYNTRPEEAPADVSALGVLVRLPASLPAKLQPSTKTLQPIKMDIMKIACWDGKDLTERGTDARWVRFTGHPCGTQNSAGVTVKNLANGYAATVFTSHGEELTTDFIPLQMGRNDILIRFENEPGSVFENQFAINRD